METILDFYTLRYNQDGLLVTINETASGASLIFYPETKTFDETHYLTIQLREREASYGTLDLSDQVVDTHPGKKKIKINSLVDKKTKLIDDYKFPFDIDYNKDLPIGLTTQTLDYFGLRIAQIYQQSLDTETLEFLEEPILLVFERYFYTWDTATKLPTGRIKEIKFYQEDGTLTEEKKLLPKEFYNTSDRADIVTKRRQTIVSWLIARATELGMEEQTKGYFALYKEETDKYILYGDDVIIDIVINSSEAFLNSQTGLNAPMDTMKNAIAFSLAKALEPTPDSEVDEYLGTLGVG